VATDGGAGGTGGAAGSDAGAGGAGGGSAPADASSPADGGADMGGGAFNRPAPAPSGAGKAGGVVADLKSGARLSGVTVTIGAATTTTDGNGAFSFDHLPSGPAVASFVKTGYAPWYATLDASVQAATAFVRMKAQGAAQPYDPSTQATVSLATPGGPFAVTFGAGTLATQATSVQVRITPIDPTFELAGLPGTLSAGAAVLVPVSFADIAVTDGAGNPLALNPGAQASIELPLPPSKRRLAAYAPGQAVDLYWYDPATGRWEDVAAATVAASSVDGATPVVRATVAHFSWYGAATAAASCTVLHGQVVSKLTGSPIANAQVTSSPGTSATTDGSGQFTVTAPVSDDPSDLATVTAQQMLVDTDGSLSGTAGTVITLFGQLPLAALSSPPAPVPCGAQASGGSGGGEPPVQLLVGSPTSSYVVSGGVDIGGNLGVDVFVGAFGVARATAASVTLVGGGYNARVIADSRQSTSAELIGAPMGPLTAGTRYTLLVDADGDGAIDATASIVASGQVKITNPGPDLAVPVNNATVSWTDSAASVAGYAARYVVTGLFPTITSGTSSGGGSGAEQPQPGCYEVNVTPFSPGTEPDSNDPDISNVNGPFVSGYFSFAAPAATIEIEIYGPDSRCPAPYLDCPGTFNSCFDPQTGTCYAGGVICGAGQLFCNTCGPSGCQGPPRCYDPTIETCDPLGNFCLSTALCGGLCYQPSIEVCLPGNIICPGGNKLCGPNCYDPSIEVCLSGNAICPIGQLVCGSQCYDPALEVCPPQGIICPTGQSICGQTCYDPSQATCYGTVACASGSYCAPANACYQYYEACCSSGKIVTLGQDCPL
jgi:hypothetical protein